MKKTFKLCAAFLTIIILKSPAVVYGYCSIQDDKIPAVSAKSAVAVDVRTKIILYEKNSEALLPIASTTKIMTALVGIKYGDLNKKLEISSNAANVHGSTVGYKKGEQITLKELLYGLMLRSGNDAAIAIAEGIGGTVEGFSKLMNEYALQIGLTNSHFTTPHGLDSEGHYSTAYDLALVTAAARENKLFNEIVSAKTADGKLLNFTRSFNNINKILWQLNGADGVKTGFTGGAGKCLVTSVKIKGNDVVIIVLNCAARWNETIKISNFIAKNFEFRQMFSKGQTVDTTKADHSSRTVKLISSEDIIIPMYNKSNYTYKIEKPLVKNILKGQILGSTCIYQDDKLIFRFNLISEYNHKEIRKWWFIK